jgi:hypothetical protein
MNFNNNKKKYILLLYIAAIIFTSNLFIDHYFLNLVFPLIKTFYLLIVIFLIGYIISGLKINNKTGILEVFAKGFVFTTGYFFIFSLLKLINAYTLSSFLLTPLFIFLLLKKKGIKKLFFKTKSILKRDNFEYLIFLIPFIYALLPSTFYDSLVYHLGLPNFFLQNGGFITAPQFMFSNMFIYYEISLIPAVFLGDFVPRLFHFFIGMIFILSVLDFASIYINIKKRKVFLATIVLLPLTMFLITTVKADLISALFIFLGIKKYIDRDYNWSAAFWGFAIGVKVFSGLAFLIFFLTIIVKNRKLEIKKHIIFGLISFTSVLPMLIKNYIFIKNPVFPFLSHIFITEFWNKSRYLLVRSEVGSSYKSILDFLKAPYTFSFKMQGAGGMIGPVFLIFLPFLAFFKKIKKGFILIFALLLLFISPFFGEAFRYIYIVFILLSIFVAMSYQFVNSRLLKILFLVLIFFNGVYSIFTLESIYSGRKIYFEGQSIDEYRMNYFPTHKAYKTINSIADKNDRILVGGEARGFHLKRKYMISSAHDYSIFKKYLKGCNSKEEFLKKIKDDGFDYLIFNLREFKRLQSYKRLDKKEEEKLFNFLQNTKPFRQEGYLYIFRL